MRHLRNNQGFTLIELVTSIAAATVVFGAASMLMLMGVRTQRDMLDAAKEQILWSLHQADVVKISEEEVDFLWHCNPEEGAKKLLEEYGVKLAMVTLGSDGAYLTNGKAAARVKCPKVHPVDTTGAGDIFGGSAIYMLLRSGTAPEDLNAIQLEGIGQVASTAASLSTEKFGGIPSVPEKRQVEKSLLNA